MERGGFTFPIQKVSQDIFFKKQTTVFPVVNFTTPLPCELQSVLASTEFFLLIAISQQLWENSTQSELLKTTPKVEF